ncbi:MAG: 50S ribosomal protein L13 [Candidatus Aenigmarchaeota archaeon]|nr:50S ribosomal protein L13 [Candidatus Aenigmarchaeota archaeon]
MKIIDASDQILGRLCSKIAKELLNGEEITVINAERSIVTGNPKSILERFKEKRDRGDPHHGPYYPRKPDKIFRRCVRDMLPYKKPRGREALKRLKVYTGNPKNLEGIKIAKSKREIESKYLTLGEISERI